MKRQHLPGVLSCCVLLFAGIVSAEPDRLTSADIDKMAHTVWESKGLEPVKQSTDAEFLRRVTFDLTGEPPSFSQAENFLKSTNPNKRKAAIDRLLEDPAYATHRANLMMERIVEGRVLNRRLPERSFEAYFETSYRSDKPYNQLVSEMISATGDSGENGATYLVVTHQANPEDLTSTVTRLFNGVQYRCFQCHDDKFGDWEQTDFWGTAAFFARVDVRPGEKKDGRLVSLQVLEQKRGEGIIPEGGITPTLRGLPKMERQQAMMETKAAERSNPVTPTFLGESVDLKRSDQRRHALAKLITSNANSLFARATVNQVWADLFGKGLIEPVDDIYGKDAAEWEPLLASLSEEFIRSGHSLKHLYALIANSDLYQLTSVGDESTENLTGVFARSRLRAHSPTVLLASIFKTTQTEEALERRRNKVETRGKRNGILQKFSFAFGNDEGNRVLSFESTIPQALMMMNDPLIERLLTPSRDSNLVHLVRESRNPKETIRKIYLATLSREPSQEETRDALDYLKDHIESADEPILLADAGQRERKARRGGFKRMKERMEPFQDLMWALMNTSEYLYNH